MKKYLLFILALLTAAAPAGCGASGAWTYDKAIDKPIVTLSAAKPVVLGDLAKNKVVVRVPGRTFDRSIKVKLETPDSVPAVPAGKFEPIGAPVEISSSQKRENKPLTFTMKVDNKYLPELRTGAIWVVYYNGADWDLIRPRSIDAAAGTLTFQSYHMSFFGTAKVPVEERIAQYTRSKALGEMAQDNMDEVVERNIKENLETLLKENFGMNDATNRFKLISSLVNDDEYREIAGKLMAGDAAGFNQDLMVFLGKKIAEEVPESTLKDMLAGLSGAPGVGYAGALSSALGFVVEGDLQSAAEAISEELIENSTVAKLFKGAGEMIKSNIELWKDGEIEAAYQAYKNGADDGYWGYDVEQGQFDQVYNQMKGISVRLESEYVTREMDRRAALSMRAPTEAELAKIRDLARKDLKAQFEARIENEDKLAKEAERMKGLIDKFKEAKLLDDGSFGYDADYDRLEDRLDRLFKLSERILRDTKREGWSSAAFTNEKALSANDMVALMQAWYSTNGQELYAAMLKEKFGGNSEAGAGIEGDFSLTGGDPGYGATSDAQALMLTALFKGAPLKVKDKEFAASHSESFSGVGQQNAQGTGSIKLSGTYDPVSAVLVVDYEFGWDVIQDAFADKDSKEKVVYSGTVRSKVTPADKTILIDYVGAITGTKSSRRVDGWTKPFTTSNQGGPGVHYKVEIE